jgi:hypothetical protein
MAASWLPRQRRQAVSHRQAWQHSCGRGSVQRDTRARRGGDAARGRVYAPAAAPAARALAAELDAFDGATAAAAAEHAARAVEAARLAAFSATERAVLGLSARSCQPAVRRG